MKSGMLNKRLINSIQLTFLTKQCTHNCLSINHERTPTSPGEDRITLNFQQKDLSQGKQGHHDYQDEVVEQRRISCLFRFDNGRQRFHSATYQLYIGEIVLRRSACATSDCTAADVSVGCKPQQQQQRKSSIKANQQSMEQRAIKSSSKIRNPSLDEFASD